MVICLSLARCSVQVLVAKNSLRPPWHLRQDGRVVTLLRVPQHSIPWGSWPWRWSTVRTDDATVSISFGVIMIPAAGAAAMIYFVNLNNSCLNLRSPYRMRRPGCAKDSIHHPNSSSKSESAAGDGQFCVIPARTPAICHLKYNNFSLEELEEQFMQQIAQSACQSQHCHAQKPSATLNAKETAETATGKV